MVKQFNIVLPTSWEELSDDQMKMIFRLFARDLSEGEVKTICLLRWNKVKVLGKTGKGEYWLKTKAGLAMATAREIYNLTRPLDFMNDIPPRPVRLSRIGKHRPLNADFDGVPFEVYLYADNLFQGYLHTESFDLLKELVQVLYNSEGIHPGKATCIMAFYWMASLKRLFAQRFSHFYQPIDMVDANNMLQGGSLHKTLMEAVNAQIRALTGGDVTKEPFVMKMDTIRALTELDCKAREVEDLKKQKS